MKRCSLFCCHIWVLESNELTRGVSSALSFIGRVFIGVIALLDKFDKVWLHRSPFLLGRMGGVLFVQMITTCLSWVQRKGLGRGVSNLCLGHTNTPPPPSPKLTKRQWHPLPSLLLFLPSGRYMFACTRGGQVWIRIFDTTKLGISPCVRSFSGKTRSFQSVLILGWKNRKYTSYTNFILQSRDMFQSTQKYSKLKIVNKLRKFRENWKDNESACDNYNFTNAKNPAYSSQYE